ncbi:alpha/beta hydrolase [Novosphingobium sp.]|uniref:alpha/beta fold hydrolase n=1 Tax=Novosphingobium sp. TaxID=1874826 RepID=UPI0026306DFD|nr:alpha/beta hydrolase [Novosphingobium sp.]
MLDQVKPESRFLETGGFRSHYIEQGEGDVVILLHGGGPGADGWGNWFGCLPLFATHFRTIALDLVGYGGSEAPEGYVYSQENRNRQLIAFIEALGEGPVSVVGNSMGGATALGAAMLRPELINNLVLMGSAGLNYSVGRVGEAMKPLAGYDYTREGMARIARHLGGKNFQAVPGMVDYRFDLATRPERKASFDGINKWIIANRGLHYEEDAIAAVKTRTLVFNGKDDPIVILAQAMRFLELLENSTGFILPHCGHWAMLEAPAIFSSQTIQFLKGY